MKRSADGFTLLEALIAVAVAAVLAAVAVPAWSHASAKAHAGKAKAALAATLVESVRHSGLTGTEVVVCPSSDGVQCADSADWSGGWIAFADINGDRSRSAGETMLLKEAALGGGVRLRSTEGRRRVVFQPSGGNAGSNVTFTLCDRRGPQHATTLVLSNAGNLRQGTPTAAQAQACASGG